MARVIILTGPSGAGKTTTSRKLAEKVDGTWAYINQDEIRQQIVSGYESAGGYEQDWNEGTINQWKVSVPICTDMIKRYIEHGISCILDIFAPPKEFEKWEDGLGGTDYDLFVLLPNEEETVVRNAGRNERSRLKEKKIRINHAKFREWYGNSKVTIIDTSNKGLDDVAETILGS